MKNYIKFITLVFICLLIGVGDMTYSIASDLPPMEIDRIERKFYLDYRAGLLDENNITNDGWKSLYEYELKTGYTTPNDIPEDIIKKYAIDITVYKPIEPEPTSILAKYKENQVEIYAAYKTGKLPKNKIDKLGWKVIYEYELEQGMVDVKDVPQWAIEAFNIDLSVAKKKEFQFYKYIPILLLALPFIHHITTKRNNEVN